MILLSLGLEVKDRADILIDLTAPGALETLNQRPFTIKEGSVFRMKARFRVQHEILSGMKYVQVVKRGPLSHKMQEMIVGFWDNEGTTRESLMLEQGSYAPNTEDKREYEKKCKSFRNARQSVY